MILAIESATAACSVALFDGKGIEERHEVVGRGHAERLIPMIAELLDGRRPEAILVDCGPGSFTGIRVGLAAAQGLALGWQVPLHGFSSLAVLAVACGGEDVAAAIHGGHGELFVQRFAGSPLRAADAVQSLRPEAAASAVTESVVVGSGAQILVDARGFGEAIDRLPRASDVQHLPQELRSLPARPVYGRSPDAKPMIS